MLDYQLSFDTVTQVNTRLLVTRIDPLPRELPETIAIDSFGRISSVPLNNSLYFSVKLQVLWLSLQPSYIMSIDEIIWRCDYSMCHCFVDLQIQRVRCIP